MRPPRHTSYHAYPSLLDVATPDAPPTLPSFAELITNAQHDPRHSSSVSPRRYQQNTSLSQLPTHHIAPATELRAAMTTAEEAVRPRALSSTERGRKFRLRKRAYEQRLMKQLVQIREQIAQLESSRDLLRQKSSKTRTSNGGSLEKITREL